MAEAARASDGHQPSDRAKSEGEDNDPGVVLPGQEILVEERHHALLVFRGPRPVKLAMLQLGIEPQLARLTGGIVQAQSAYPDLLSDFFIVRHRSACGLAVWMGSILVASGTADKSFASITRVACAAASSEGGTQPR